MSEQGAGGIAARFGEVLAKRERKGSDWCRKKGIGRLRRELAAGVLPTRGSTEYRERVALAEVCRGCPLNCELRRG